MQSHVLAVVVESAEPDCAVGVVTSGALPLITTGSLAECTIVTSVGTTGTSLAVRPIESSVDCRVPGLAVVTASAIVAVNETIAGLATTPPICWRKPTPGSAVDSGSFG